MKLGIISDIHEDILGLREALGILHGQGCHEIACLGDIAGFSIPSFGYPESRDASACLALVRENCKFIVAGNHDLYPARKVPEFDAGFGYPADWYDLDYSRRKEMARDEVWLNEENELDTLLSADEKAFLGTLTECLAVEEGGCRILFSHYLYPDLSGSSRRYYEAFGPVEEHLDFIEGNSCMIGFSGHKHVEGIFRASRTGSGYEGFGEYRLDRKLQWIAGPCIANGKKENGCMIFDTESFLLKVVPLNSRPRVMLAVELEPFNNEK